MWVIVTEEPFKGSFNKMYAWTRCTEFRFYDNDPLAGFKH